MNTLSYGLLSLLSQSALSGYDLMLRIQPFWPAKHSQIYPLLAQLEREEQVRYELIAQSDKPDKKVYTLTDKGIDSLRHWLSEPASDPVTRDELYLKSLCLFLVDPAVSRALFENRLQVYKSKQLLLHDKIAQLEKTGQLAPGAIPAYSSPQFGGYILLTKAIRVNETNLEWCEWALKQIPSADNSQ
jgi:PadR family transcriptional regulator AphA